MTETEFLRQAEATLEAIEASLEASGLDVECSRAGNVLTIELEDGSRIVVNTQAPTRQIWVAARSGGFHFAADGAAWRDTRGGAELFAVLSRILSEQGGRPVVLTPLSRRAGEGG